MPRQTFPWFPVTLERPTLDILWIGQAAHYDSEAEVVIVDDAYQGRLFDVAVVDVLNNNEMRWRGLMDEPYIIRPTRPDDAERWDWSLRIPLPTEIIGAILTTNMPSPTLAAAVDAQGDVHTMILETGVGLYARYSASWIRMTDISPIEQLDIVEVPPDDLNIYDAADQRGNTVNVAYLHPLNPPSKTAVDVTPEPAVPTVASVAPVATVASVADLPDAVEFGLINPDSRWYITRRWKALGGEATGVVLPWENEGS
jgi:hypothetical protein